MLPVTICVTLVLIMLGGVVAAVTMAGHFSRGIKENFTVEVLLDDSISQRDLQALKANLEKASKCEKLAARAAKDIEFAQYR